MLAFGLKMGYSQGSELSQLFSQSPWVLPTIKQDLSEKDRFFSVQNKVKMNSQEYDKLPELTLEKFPFI